MLTPVDLVLILAERHCERLISGCLPGENVLAEMCVLRLVVCRCLLGVDFRSAVAGGAHSGWHWVNEASQGQQDKWGFTSKVPGSVLLMVVDTQSVLHGTSKVSHTRCVMMFHMLVSSHDKMITCHLCSTMYDHMPYVSHHVSTAAQNPQQSCRTHPTSGLLQNGLTCLEKWRCCGIVVGGLFQRNKVFCKSGK